MFDTAIITAPRKIHYLGTMLDNYFETWGQTKPHVFAEPNTPWFFNRGSVDFHQNTETLGCVNNWWFAAKWMLENTQRPYIMMCEDDIEFSENAKLKIENLLKVFRGEIPNEIVRRYLPLEKIGYISPYCAKICANGRDWHKPNLRKAGQCGALCMIFPRRSLERIIESETYFTEASHGKHLDYAIGATATKHLELIALTHVPTLVFHIGEHSTTASNNTEVNKRHESRQPAL